MDQLDNPADGDQVEIEPQEEEVEPQAPVMVHIRYNKETYEVPEHMADLWHEREEDHKRQLVELDRLRKVQPAQIRQDQPPSSAEDRDLKFFQSPSQALEEALTERDRQWAERIAFQKLQDKYWDAFYKEHNHLVGRETVVESVLNQNVQYLATLSPTQSRKELGEYVTTLLTPTDQGTKKRLPQGQVVSERASNPPTTRRAASKAEEESYSGEDVLRQRRERMRRAMYKIPKG